VSFLRYSKYFLLASRDENQSNTRRQRALKHVEHGDWWSEEIDEKLPKSVSYMYLPMKVYPLTLVHEKQGSRFVFEDPTKKCVANTRNSPLEWPSWRGMLIEIAGSEPTWRQKDRLGQDYLRFRRSKDTHHFYQADDGSFSSFAAASRQWHKLFRLVSEN
jgi:hypothetical protein